MSIYTDLRDTLIALYEPREPGAVPLVLEPVKSAEHALKASRYVSLREYTKDGVNRLWVSCVDNHGMPTIKQLMIDYPTRGDHVPIFEILESGLGIRVKRETRWAVTTSGQFQYQTKAEHEE